MNRLPRRSHRPARWLPVFLLPLLAALLIGVITPSEAAQSLSDPDAVSKYRDAQRGRTPRRGAKAHEAPDASDHTSSAASIAKRDRKKRSRAEDDDPPDPDAAPRFGVDPVRWLTTAPDDYSIPRGHAVCEFGYHHWDLSSASGSGIGPGGGFTGEYRIEPVETMRFGGVARLGNWGGGLTYLASPDGHEAELLYGTLMLFPSGGGAWWALSGESGRVEGIASATDFSGAAVTSAVDTNWERVRLLWQHWSGLNLGLAYETLAMPSVLSLDDADGPVVALFDDSTEWRTFSLVCGVDRARTRLSRGATGWSFDYGWEAGIGMGQLSVDEAGIREITDEFGYQLEVRDTLLTFALDGSLGVSYTGMARVYPWQFYIGGRGRLSNWVNTTQASDDPLEYDTLQMDAELTVLTTGLFTRFSLFW
jgi:hypothetical protein